MVVRVVYRDGTTGPDGVVDEDALPQVGEYLILRDGREVVVAGYAYTDQDVSALLAMPTDEN